MGNEYSYFMGKVVNSLICGAFLGVGLKLANNLAIKNKKRVLGANKKYFRLILRKTEDLNREYIIQLGRQSIRCGFTNKIMLDPVVNADGISYEKKEIEEYTLKNRKLPNRQILNLNDLNFSVLLFKNRALKELIEKLHSYKSL
jgi:hypothetical protein